MRYTYIVQKEVNGAWVPFDNDDQAINLENIEKGSEVLIPFYEGLEWRTDLIEKHNTINHQPIRIKNYLIICPILITKRNVVL